MIRPFTSTDDAAIGALVDETSDPLWVAQGHTLHGADLDDTRWRRTLVAELDGRLAGAATVATNRVHHSRYNVAVEVAAPLRRLGIATALGAAITAVPRPRPLPLGSKIRPSDVGSVRLVDRFGGHVYQRCPGLRPDPLSAEVVAWCAAQQPVDGVTLHPLDEVDAAIWPQLWTEQYLWVHARWAPADPTALRGLADLLVADVDPAVSVAAVRDAQVEAVVWAMREDDGMTTLVAETTRRDVPGGTGLLAAALARCLQVLAGAGSGPIELDGHDDDPHLAPVLATMPPVPADPVHLVELG